MRRIMVAATVWLAACKGDEPVDTDTDGAGDGDDTAAPDDTDGGDTGDAGTCPLASTYGTIDGTAWEVVVGGDTEWPIVQAPLDGDDLISIETFGQTGTFPDDVTTGTFEIGANDAQYRTCGLCVRLFADVTETGAGAYYLASSGTVEITRRAAGFEGTLTDVVFDQVEIEPDPPYTSTVVGTCVTRIDHMTFSAFWSEVDCFDGLDEDADQVTDCDDLDCLSTCGL